jgi:hypothetical protein
MPTIAIVFGLTIQMYWRDHPPPHIHVFYGGSEALIAIETGDAGARDFSDLITKSGSMVEPLRHTAFFARVFLQHSVLARPNGFDLDAIALHQEMAAAGTLKRASAVS